MIPEDVYDRRSFVRCVRSELLLSLVIRLENIENLVHKSLLYLFLQSPLFISF